MIKSILFMLAATFTLAGYVASPPTGSGAADVQLTDTCTVDLSEMGALTVVNRTASLLNDGDRVGVRLDEQPGDGVAWLEGCTFSEGVIEFEVRGKDVQGRSFVGIAFHGVNDSTYEAVYLRPFNFRAEDPGRRDHAVQYISHPAHTWFVLRESHPEVYENPVQPAPDPNGWVPVRIVVDDPKVSVFVGEGQEPDLVVDRLSNRNQGRVGLWVGNSSGGDFANLVVRPTS